MTKGVYQIKNLINDKIYIGSAVNIEQRWRSHKSLLCNNIHYNEHLQNAWNKNGSENFAFDIIETIGDTDVINEREQHWINISKCYERELGYNLCQYSYSKRGVKASDFTKALMSSVRKGRPFTTENERLNKGFKKGNIYSKGKSLSEEHKAKLVLSNKGKPRSDQVKAKISASNKNKPKSEAHKAKIKLSWIKRRKDKLDKQNANERL